MLRLDVVFDRDAVRRAMGIVFQEPALEQRLSGRDNLLLMGLFYGLASSVAKRRAVEILEGLGLTECADRRTSTLSGGQRRKLELARALVTEGAKTAGQWPFIFAFSEAYCGYIC